MYRKLLFINLLVFHLFAFSQQKYSNEFLSIGIGARAHALSGSVVASSSDVYSTYWNMAGLTELKFDRNIAAMHSEYFAGIAKFDYGAFIAKIDKTSTAGVSVIRFAVDDIPDTSELIDSEGNIKYGNVKSFSASDLAVIVSYARKLKPNGLSLGGNVKIIKRTVGDFAKSWGFGIDLSTRYAHNHWLFGANFRDITTTFNAWSYSFSDKMKEVYTLTGNTIPDNTLELTYPKIILGMAYNYKPNANFIIQPELDFDISTDGKRNVLIQSNSICLDPHFGVEIGYKEMIFLRSGIGNIQQETDENGKLHRTFQPNIGLGVKLKNFLTIDYAYTDIGNNSLALYSHVFSLSFSFNRKK